jgi:hypothetical protein
MRRGILLMNLLWAVFWPRSFGRILIRQCNLKFASRHWPKDSMARPKNKAV